MTTLVVAVTAVVALAVALLRVRHAPRELVRINVRGLGVPAVLGEAVSAGTLAGTATAAILGYGRTRSIAALVIVVVAFYVVGALDDWRGDESSRGFKGHLAALARGRVTGGIVKLIGGGAAGCAAGIFATGSVVRGIVTGLIVALTANLLNLLDRAPGRAAKAALIVGASLAVAAPGPLKIPLIAALVAVAVVAPLDLRERAMLGDAGANPIGAAIGLILALTLPVWGGGAALVVLLGLNLLSEKVSFSRVIESTPVLASLDRWGRTR